MIDEAVCGRINAKRIQMLPANMAASKSSCRRARRPKGTAEPAWRRPRHVPGADTVAAADWATVYPAEWGRVWEDGRVAGFDNPTDWRPC